MKKLKHIILLCFAITTLNACYNSTIYQSKYPLYKTAERLGSDFRPKVKEGEEPKAPTTLVLKNVFVINPTAKNIHELKPQTIIINHSKIVSITEDATQLPDNATIIDMTGKYAMPGLIDAHVHLGTAPSLFDTIDWSTKRFKVILRGGVTSVQDLSGDARALAFYARATLSGDMEGPSIYYSANFSGKSFNQDWRAISAQEGFVPGTTPWNVTTNPDYLDYKREMINAKAIGANILKLYADMDYATLAKISRDSDEAGIPTFAHSAIFPAKPSEVVEAGIDVLVHSNYLVWEGLSVEHDYNNRMKSDYSQVEPNGSEIKMLIDKMLKKGTILHPNLITNWSRLKEDPHGFKWASQATKYAFERGVPILAGSDFVSKWKVGQSVPFLHKELELLVKEVGMTPLEAIRSATSFAAKVLKLDHKIGLLAPGMDADILVLNSNPLINIKNTTDILTVIKHGRLIGSHKDK